ncbi:GNAT family N-acetyltransferase [Micrococcales bacterium 31B]|nr:GNAT family N-acetyltransferase [Micrococcales bacterium 31B]
MTLLTFPSRLAVGDDLALRLATAADAHLIRAWTDDPAVHEHWAGRPLTLDEVRADYTGARAPAVASYVIEEHGVPRGYLQAWQDDDARGLDMFMAAEAQGRGLGPRVARALARDLTARGWRHVTADPAERNSRGQRAWARAGFEPTGERGEDDGHPTVILCFRDA